MSEPDGYASFRLKLDHGPELMSLAMGLLAGDPKGVALGPAEPWEFDGEDVVYRVPMKRYEREGLA